MLGSPIPKCKQNDGERADAGIIPFPQPPRMARPIVYGQPVQI